MVKIVAIPGSLRKQSSNKSLLKALARLAPENVEIALCESIGGLPHFNPDLEQEEPGPVSEFKAQIRAADGLLISSPEYAHGVPGALKNALDWLAGGSEVVGKPVALLNASPRATHAQASLAEILATLSARIIPEASVAVPLLGKNLGEGEIAGHPEFSKILSGALASFVDAVQSGKPKGR